MTISPILRAQSVYSFAQVVLDPTAGKDTVVLTEPGYPVYERGALFAGGRVETLLLLERNGFLPELDAVPVEVWRRAALVWVNYPNNRRPSARRSPSTSASPGSRASTASCSPRTRRTRSSGSATRRSPRSSSPT